MLGGHLELVDTITVDEDERDTQKEKNDALYFQSNPVVAPRCKDVQPGPSFEVPDAYISREKHH